jgi:hypothetical protein
MSRRGWLIALLAGGVGLAVLIGVLGTRNDNSSASPTKAQATTSLCTSLTAFDGSLKTLTSLDPSTATKDELQTDVDAVQAAWTQVQNDFQAVQSAPSGELSSAWSGFESAVKDIPNAGSASDAATSVEQAAKQVQTAAESTAQQLSCGGTSASTTTTTS